MRGSVVPYYFNYYADKASLARLLSGFGFNASDEAAVISLAFSAFNVLGIIGGDADLSPRGEEYARSLAGFVRKRVAERPPTADWWRRRHHCSDVVLGQRPDPDDLPG